MLLLLWTHHLHIRPLQSHSALLHFRLPYKEAIYVCPFAFLSLFTVDIFSWTFFYGKCRPFPLFSLLCMQHGMPCRSFHFISSFFLLLFVVVAVYFHIFEFRHFFSVEISLFVVHKIKWPPWYFCCCIIVHQKNLTFSPSQYYSWLIVSDGFIGPLRSCIHSYWKRNDEMKRTEFCAWIFHLLRSFGSCHDK